jgi:hypothetical protein
LRASHKKIALFLWRDVKTSLVHLALRFIPLKEFEVLAIVLNCVWDDGLSPDNALAIHICGDGNNSQLLAVLSPAPEMVNKFKQKTDEISRWRQRVWAACTYFSVILISRARIEESGANNEM